MVRHNLKCIESHVPIVIRYCPPVFINDPADVGQTSLAIFHIAKNASPICCADVDKIRPNELPCAPCYCWSTMTTTRTVSAAAVTARIMSAIAMTTGIMPAIITMTKVGGMIPEAKID